MSRDPSCWQARIEFGVFTSHRHRPEAPTKFHPQEPRLSSAHANPAFTIFWVAGSDTVSYAQVFTRSHFPSAQSVFGMTLMRSRCDIGIAQRWLCRFAERTTLPQ